MVPEKAERTMLQQTSSRSGSVLLIAVLGSLMVLGMLGFSLYRSMLEKSHFVNAHSIAVLMDMAAFEIAEVVFNSVAEDLQNPRGALFQGLLKARPLTDFPYAVPDNTSIWAKSFAYKNRKEFNGISPVIQVRFVNPVSLSANTSWTDPWEKQMSLEVSVVMAYGKIGMRSMGKTYRFRRPCRIHSLFLPVVSKFTLFLKEPIQTDERNEGYNCFGNFINGKRVQSSKVLPIIFFNHPDFKQTDLTKAGYVFMGGTKDIQLHLTAGTDPNNGEFFHFFNINSTSRGAPVFTMKNLPSTSGFNAPVTLSKEPLIKGRLGIQGVMFGFYSLDKMNPPNSMNFKNALEKYFATSKSRSMKSSSLHLFGNLKNPSPTTIFGHVMRVFGQYTYLTADLDLDGKFECRWSILRSPADYRSGGSNASVWDLVRLPKRVRKKRSRERVTLDGTMHLRSIFMTPKQYENCASRLVMEEYNLGYEYLMDENSKIPPATKYKERTGVDPLRTGESFKLKRIADSTELFKGNLNQITTNDLIRGRISMEYKTAEKFLAACVSDSALNLHGKTIYVGEPVTLPANLTVKTPGTLIANGDLTLLGNITAENQGYLTLVAAKSDSNILLSGTNQEIQAHLIALSGTIKPTNPSNRPKIRGGIALKSLIPQDWPAGAEITYEPGRDPTQINADGYTFILADFYDEWSAKK